ncbi:MAG: hypothetical protein JWM44_1540 [Bacilli bacterium]|nr:hypothetical protein [Bacilli bacterium]
MAIENVVDITGLDQVEVFRRLYNNARPQGLGFLHFIPRDMTPEEAVDQFTLDSDYVNGRVMKIRMHSREGQRNEFVRFGWDEEKIAENLPHEQVTYYFDPWLYNRDNGAGEAEHTIDNMRLELNIPVAPLNVDGNPPKDEAL